MAKKRKTKYVVYSSSDRVWIAIATYENDLIAELIEAGEDIENCDVKYLYDYVVVNGFTRLYSE